MYANKIVQELDKLSNDPFEMGKSMAYQQKAIQDRFFQMTMGFIKELAHQKETGSFINGNMETSYRAWGILESLLTNDGRVL